MKPSCLSPVFLKVVTGAVDTTAIIIYHQDPAQGDRYRVGDGWLPVLSSEELLNNMGVCGSCTKSVKVPSISGLSCCHRCLSGTPSPHYHDHFPSLEEDPNFILVWSRPTGPLEHRRKDWSPLDALQPHPTRSPLYFPPMGRNSKCSFFLGGVERGQASPATRTKYEWIFQ